MISGGVNARSEAVVQLQVRGPGGIALNVDTVVDSGFSGALTLPAATVAALGLVRQSGSVAVLADGSVRPIEIYAAEVEWDSVWRPILVSAVGEEPLLGMRLLAGHELRIAIVPGGVVEISRLP